MNFRLGRWRFRMKKSKVATLVRLGHFVEKQGLVTAPRWSRARFPSCAPCFQLGIGLFHVDPTGSNVERNEVTVPHQRQGAPDSGLRRNMQHAGTVARATHTGIGNSHHVPHACLQELF